MSFSLHRLRSSLSHGTHIRIHPNSTLSFPESYSCFDFWMGYHSPILTGEETDLKGIALEFLVLPTTDFLCNLFTSVRYRLRFLVVSTTIFLFQQGLESGMLMSSSLSAHAMGLRSIWTFTRALTRRPLLVLHDSTNLSNNKLHNGLALTPQMGMTDMVFPGAVHTRFEHSHGVCWLAGDAVHQLLSNHGPDLDIDRFDIQNVKLVGLLHHLGHVSFSHMFESELLPWILHHRKCFLILHTLQIHTETQSARLSMKLHDLGGLNDGIFASDGPVLLVVAFSDSTLRDRFPNTG